MNRKIGRNDPCPCGSGKKYKRCCGSALATGLSINKTEESIKFNQAIAYIGKVGRRREEFCIRYLEHKRKAFNEVNKAQKLEAAEVGQVISCYKGCSFCCNELVSASLGECELILFYLYNHEEVMKTFLEAISSWLESIQKHEDVFRRIEDARSKSHASGLSERSVQLLGRELQSYYKLQIPCPFLVNQTCSIYEVRPWACSSVFAVTPSEWCNPLNRHAPKYYQSQLPLDIVTIPFYDKDSSITPPDCNLPDTVYRILLGGFQFLSGIPGLESLYQEILHDEEIHHFMKQRR